MATGQAGDDHAAMRTAEVETIEVTDWADFQRVLAPYLSNEHVFRGVADKSYDLRPKIGRARYLQVCEPDEERRLLNLFKRQAAPFFPVRPLNNWEWLAIAQHHGVPTRLLDWSENPLVSAFFAVWDDNPGTDAADGAVYVLKKPRQYTEIGDVARADEDQPGLRDPFAVEELVFVYAPHIFQRIASQHGLFTVHADPKAFFESPDLRRVVIPSRLKEGFRLNLDAFGFSHATIFGDLDGVSRRIDWLTARAAAAAVLLPEPSRASAAGDVLGARAGRSMSGATGTATTEQTYPLPNIRHPNDPQRDRWGGQSSRDGWSVAAHVVADSSDKDWFRITVELSGPPLDGRARFHLHQTFHRQVLERQVEAGSAKLVVYAYGAFTIGVEVHPDDPGGGAMVPLELNLGKLVDVPQLFRER